MRIILVLGVVGQLLRLFSIAFVVPLVFAMFEGAWTSAGHFAVALVATLAFGFLFGRFLKEEDTRMFHRAEALGVVAFTWLGIGLFGAIPYVFEGLSFVDALFESISGFTTTGATILTDFSLYDRSFYLWRSMTQWIGGLGVIALFVIVLPRLGIAGRQLFFAEASGAPGEAVSPQVRHAAARLWLLYTGITAVLIVLLMIAGMPLFDAVCHSFTTLAAGGFSPNPASVAGYENAAVEWILVVFMLIGGTSFPLIWTVLTRRPLEFLRDGEFKFYIAVSVGGGVAMAIVLAGGIPGEEELRLGLFQSASVISSTGFASTDYNLWADGARALIVLVGIVGGCAGSAAGGPKAVRHFLVLKHIGRELKRVLHPKAVIPVKYKGQVVSNEQMRQVFLVVFLYAGMYFFFGLVMVLTGHDMVEGFSASLACLGNIGPAFGSAGPMGNFAAFTEADKLILTAAMWIGRLEIITVLALLHPHVLSNLKLTGRGRRHRRLTPS